VLAWTVLGGSPAWPNPGQAASGYLVQSDRAHLLLDCGSGIAQELRALDPAPLTDILITHFHADHWFDLVPLHYAFRYGSWNTRPRPTLHLPPGGRAVLDTVASVWDGSVETFEAAFDVMEYDPHADLRIADLHITFAPCLHYTTCYSVKLDTPGAVIVFSADTAPTERLARFAHGADLFVCEAALGDASNDSSERGHMDPVEAGREAARAGAKRLLLTHVPAELGDEFVLERAATQFSGRIDLARPGLRIELNAS
jgi:ribonuclease BN (tRNA processing enzyme)